jgi:hypothetical protein
MTELLYNTSLYSLIDYFWCLTPLSAKSWQPVLVVEEPERTTDHGQATGNLFHLWLRVECTLFVIYKAGREPMLYW